MMSAKRVEKPTIRVTPATYARLKKEAEGEGSNVSARAEAILSMPGFLTAAHRNGAVGRLTEVQARRVEEVRQELQARSNRKAEKKGAPTTHVMAEDALEWMLHRAWNRIHTLNAYYCDDCGTTARCARHRNKGESSKLGDDE